AEQLERHLGLEPRVPGSEHGAVGAFSNGLEDLKRPPTFRWWAHFGLGAVRSRRHGDAVSSRHFGDVAKNADGVAVTGMPSELGVPVDVGPVQHALSEARQPGSRAPPHLDFSDARRSWTSFRSARFVYRRAAFAVERPWAAAIS